MARSGGMSRSQVMKEANKAFPGVFGIKLNSSEIGSILSMQSMLDPIFTEKQPIDAKPRGPVHVQKFRINARTNTDSLLRSFMPTLRYESEYSPLKIKLLSLCSHALSSQTCLIMQAMSMPTNQMNQLRSALQEHSVKLLFIKPTILRKALIERQMNGLAEISKGQLILMYSAEEPSRVKPAWEIVDKTRKMIILSGLIEGHAYCPSQCTELITKVPSKQAMHHEIAHLLSTPAIMLSRLLERPLQSFPQLMQMKMSKL